MIGKRLKSEIAQDELSDLGCGDHNKAQNPVL
jgi:hypothetical protein